MDKQQKRKQGRVTRISLTALLGMLCLVFACFLLADALKPLALPNDSADFAQVITDANGRPLRSFADKNGVWRYPVSLNDVSSDYLTALLHYEDKWFYYHPGVNPVALMRASWQWLVNGKAISGGSTLTMQVARLLYPHNKSIAGKAYQIFRALQLEWHYDKATILTLYLNYAPFGGPLEGVQAASFRYFDKPANYISKAEAALLAVLPQAPSRLRPDRHPQRAQQARDKVLNRLLAGGVWSSEVITEAKQEAVYASVSQQPTFAPILARRLRHTFKNKAVIQSTIDIDLQAALADKLSGYVSAFPEHSSGAILLVENNTRQVKAYIGSADFNDPKRYGHVDMISALRSPGSTLKPLLFAMALDDGLIHEQSMLLDTPSDFNGYRPQNFSQQFSGLVSAKQALQRSLNVPAVQVLDALQAETFYSRLANANIHLALPRNAKPNLSIILGGVGMSLESLVMAYAALGTNGQVESLRYTNETLPSPSRYLVSKEAAWVTANALRESGIEQGGEYLAHADNRRSAFKTGTSFGFRDAWTIATSQHYTIGIWIGRPDGSAMPGNYGRNTALPLLQQILPLLPANATQLTNKPNKVSKHTICWPLGTLAERQSKSTCLRQYQAWLIDETAPLSLREPTINAASSYVINSLVNAKGKRVLPHCTSAQNEPLTPSVYAVWPLAAEPYLDPYERRIARIPALAEACYATSSGYELRIEGINQNALIVKSPSAAQAPHIALFASGGQGQTYWYLNNEYRGTTIGTKKIHLAIHQQGKNRVSIIDGTGQMAQVNFEYNNT